MKKFLTYFIALCIIALVAFGIFYFYKVAQQKKFFKNGEVQLKNPVEKINLNYINDLPFVKVSINGKQYNFLFDSGAPTAISYAVYNELNLEKQHNSQVTDSQENKKEQILTELPEMIVDNILFKNFGAVVINLNEWEMKCLKIDGVLGANMMAKLFWRVNYSESSLEASKDLSHFNLKGYDAVMPFEPKPQKTPVVKAKILGQEFGLTFDTGSTGRFEIPDNNYDPKKTNVKNIETYGTSSIGVFGASKPATGHIFKTDVLLGNDNFKNELITTGNDSDRIGNKFLKDFIFILDWKNNKVYMKRVEKSSSKLESFGFGYRFINEKPIVVSIFKDIDFPLKVGDSIISINNVDLTHLDKESSCNYFLNAIEKDAESIDIKLKRNNTILDFKLERKVYLK